MKYSVNVPDDVAEAARAAAVAEGVTQAEWSRRALLAYLHPAAPTAHPPATDAAGVDLGTLADSAAAMRAALDARDEARHDLAEERLARAEALRRVAHLEGVAEERLARVGDAYTTIARLTPEADRTPPPMLTGPGTLDRIRAWWAGRRR